jgi:hypothetical protein
MPKPTEGAHLYDGAVLVLVAELTRHGISPAAEHTVCQLLAVRLVQSSRRLPHGARVHPHITTRLKDFPPVRNMVVMMTHHRARWRTSSGVAGVRVFLEVEFLRTRRVRTQS